MVNYQGPVTEGRRLKPGWVTLMVSQQLYQTGNLYITRVIGAGLRMIRLGSYTNRTVRPHSHRLAKKDFGQDCLSFLGPAHAISAANIGRYSIAWRTGRPSNGGPRARMASRVVSAGSRGVTIFCCGEPCFLLRGSYQAVLPGRFFLCSGQ